MSAIWLLIATPRDPATGAPVTARLAGGGARGYTQFGSVEWAAGLTRPPAIVQRLGFEAGEYGAGAVVQALELRWSGTAARHAALARLYWRDAPFTLYSGPDGGADAQMAVVLSGLVDDVKVEPGALSLAMADPAVALTKPVVTATHAGTGGIEGPAELKGRAKRRAWGVCRNVELVSLEPANNIWVATDPARHLLAIDQIYDRGNAASAVTLIAWAGSIAATLAALQAVACPQGGGAAAPSIGCIKWWFANPGKLTCDLRGECATPGGGGYVDRPSDIAQKIIGAVAGPPVDAAMAAAARAARDVACGWTVADTTNQAGAELNALLGPVSLWWALSSTGVIEFGRWAWDAPVATLRGARVDRSRTHKPVKRISVGWRPNHTVMARGDIAQSLLAADVGGLGSGATANSLTDMNKAEGDKLAGVQGGATKGATVGVDLLRQPPTGGPLIVSVADILTSEGTAAGITGQSPWATETRTPAAVFEGAANLVPDGGFRLRGNGWQLGAFGWVEGGSEGVSIVCAAGGTNVAVSPAFPVAANLNYSLQAEQFAGGMTGGNLVLDVEWRTATAVIGYSNRITAVNGTGWTRRRVEFISPAGATLARVRVFTEGATNTNVAVRRVKLNSGWVDVPFTDEATRGALYDDGVSVQALKPATSLADRTINATASGFTGQGSLATKNAAAWNVDVSGRPGVLVAGMRQGGDRLEADRIGYYAAGEVFVGSVLDFKPATTGADKTSNATAAAITGQGPLATGPVPVRLLSDPNDGTKLDAGRINYPGIGTVADFRPQEAGANKTINNTAAGFVGQAAIATDAGAKPKLDGVAPGAGTSGRFVTFGAGIAIQGNSASKTTAGDGFPTQQGVLSQSVLRGAARVEISVPVGLHAYFYLTTDGPAGQMSTAVPDMLGCGFAWAGGDWYKVTATGVPLQGPYTGHSDQWVVEYDGDRVRSFVNNGLVDAVAVPAGVVVRLKLILYTPHTVRDLQFSEPTNIARMRRFGEASGRVTDPTAYNTSLLLGPSNVTNIAPSYTVGANNVTVSLPAHVRKIAGQTAPVTLSYGAVSFVVAYSAAWHAYVDDPNLAGVASPAAGVTGDPSDLLVSGRYHLASGTAPNAAGTGGTTGGGGGSGGGGGGDGNVKIP